MALRVRGFTEGDLFRIAHPTLDEPVGIEPNLAHLGRLIEEVKHAGKNMVANVTIPSSNDLFAQLCNATKQLPASYADRFAKPLLTHLSKRLRQERDLVLSSIERNAVRAVLLNGNICPRATDADSRSFCRATEAAQELASDLYDQFVAELGPRIPRERTTPSLHTWGSAQEGPYTYHIRYLERLGLKTTMVVLPTVNALGGILAWTTYAHEVAGHNLLHAGRCLNGELQTVIFNKIHYGSHLPRTLASYWSKRVDETVSDVLGVLKLGPAAGIGLVGYFRALSPSGQLRANGNANDPHPSDLVRGLLAARVIRQLNLSNARTWADAIEGEVLKDWPKYARNSNDRQIPVRKAIELGGEKYSYNKVIKSVDAVANAALHTKLECMGNRSLFELGAWNDKDRFETEAAMNALKGAYNGRSYRAVHVVSAATLLALEPSVHIPAVFNQMIDLLSGLHQNNAHWGAA